MTNQPINRTSSRILEKATFSINFSNLNDLNAAYEAILRAEGMAPIGENPETDLAFMQKKNEVETCIARNIEDIDKENEELFYMLSFFSTDVRTDWAIGLLSDGQIKALYRDFRGNPAGFPRESLNDELKKSLEGIHLR